MQACRVKGLQAVAITDHHDMAFVPFIREAAELEVDPTGQPVSENDRLVVFPGVELTLGVPCQALLILDADFPTDRLSVVLEALAINVTDPAMPSLGQVVRCDHIDSLGKLYETLNAREWLRNRYIVLPNVTDGGLGTLMRSGMQSKYKEMPCVGGYLDGSITKLGKGNRAKIAGEDIAWGNRRIGLFQTSDSRSSTFESLGRHSTWVKWAVPTAEALRQACLAQESRISQEQPSLPNAFITRISVANSKFMGPVELELNQQYNAIIGGRGTGKSTILEYLRWALCDERPTDPTDETPDHAQRQQRLINETLRPLQSLVEVHFVINGIPHTVRRTAAPNGDVLLKVGDGALEKVSEADVRAILPIHAYSQKQLSSVSVRADELTRFVTAPISAQLNSIDAHIVDLAGRIRQKYAALQRYRHLETSIARNKLAVESTKRQADTIRASLTTLTDADRMLLDQKPAFDHASNTTETLTRKLEQASGSANEFVEILKRLLDDLPDLDPQSQFAAVVRPIGQEVRSILADMLTHASAAAAVVAAGKAAGSAYTDGLEVWRVQGQTFSMQYAATKAASATQESQLAELTRLEQLQNQTSGTLAQQQEEKDRLGDPAATHLRLRQEWIGLLRERSECMRAQCANLSTFSDGLLKATIRQGIGLRDMTSRLRSIATGTGLRGAKHEDLIQRIQANEDPLVAWEEFLAELEKGVTTNKEGGATTEALSSLRRHGFTDSEATKFLSRLTPEKWLDLALAPVHDSPRFMYRVRESDYIAFESASAGQQATALLSVLLNQEGPPLIIDQPEDDLDSQVIQEVVAKIWVAKTRRQLVFTSHNANLVVNGDAELVVCCDYRVMGEQSGGAVKLQGAIDMPEVRKEITSIMEGGERAFQLRKEKYGF